MKSFKTRLIARGPGGAWTHLDIPFSVEKEFGTKARVPVAGTLNGFAFRTSLMPNGDGTHSMAVNKAMQAGAKAVAGDLVVDSVRNLGQRGCGQNLGLLWGGSPCIPTRIEFER